VILAIALCNLEIVDTGDPAAHEAIFVKFPVLVTVRTIPVTGVIMPLIGKPNGNPIVLESPKLFD
jgi:hypothetical protein